MNLPSDALGWVFLVIKILAGTVPLGAVYILLSRIAAHSICLSGQRTSEESAEIVRYRFALQNNEEAPLTVGKKLKIKILDSDGDFAGPSPLVYAGCTKFEQTLDFPRKIWIMVFEELPAYDTWAIECSMNKNSQNIQLTIENDESSLTPQTRLSSSELLLRADQKSVFVGRRKTPEGWWAWFVSGVALAVYCFWCFLFRSDLPYLDIGFVLVIVAFATVLFHLTRRDAPSITQGYTKPSTGRGVSRTN